MQVGEVRERRRVSLREFLGVDFGVVRCPVCGREGVLCVESSPDHTHNYLVVVHGDSCEEGMDAHKVPLYLSRLGQCLGYTEAREIVEIAKLGARADDPYIVGNKRLRFVTSSGKKEVELGIEFKKCVRYGELFRTLNDALRAELDFLFRGGRLVDVLRAQGIDVEEVDAEGVLTEAIKYRVRNQHPPPNLLHRLAAVSRNYPHLLSIAKSLTLRPTVIMPELHQGSSVPLPSLLQCPAKASLIVNKTAASLPEYTVIIDLIASDYAKSGCRASSTIDVVIDGVGLVGKPMFVCGDVVIEVLVMSTPTSPILITPDTILQAKDAATKVLQGLSTEWARDILSKAKYEGQVNSQSCESPNDPRIEFTIGCLAHRLMRIPEFDKYLENLRTKGIDPGTYIYEMNTADAEIIRQTAVETAYSSDDGLLDNDITTVVYTLYKAATYAYLINAKGAYVDLVLLTKLPYVGMIRRYLDATSLMQTISEDLKSKVNAYKSLDPETITKTKTIPCKHCNINTQCPHAKYAKQHDTERAKLNINLLKQLITD